MEIINHHGKFYVGSVEDYILCCRGFYPDHKTPPGMRLATIDDIMKWQEELIKGGKTNQAKPREYYKLNYEQFQNE